MVLDTCVGTCVHKTTGSAKNADFNCTKGLECTGLTQFYILENEKHIKGILFCSRRPVWLVRFCIKSGKMEK